MLERDCDSESECMSSAWLCTNGQSAVLPPLPPPFPGSILDRMLSIQQCCQPLITRLPEACLISISKLQGPREQQAGSGILLSSAGPPGPAPAYCLYRNQGETSLSLSLLFCCSQACSQKKPNISLPSFPAASTLLSAPDQGHYLLFSLIYWTQLCSLRGDIPVDLGRGPGRGKATHTQFRKRVPSHSLVCPSP